MKTYTTLENQNFFDVSLMLYGDIENAFKIAYDNKVSLNDGLLFGQSLIYDENNKDSIITKENILKKGIVITTGSLSGTPESVDNPDFADLFDDTFDETFE